MAADAITVREAELLEQRAAFEESRRVLLVSAVTPGNLDAIDSDGIGHGQGRVLASQRLTQLNEAIDAVNAQLAQLCVSQTGQPAILTAQIGSEESQYYGDTEEEADQT